MTCIYQTYDRSKLDSCQTPISAYVRRYRYILILTPISALISMIPDIGYTRYRRIPDIGYTRYRETPDIGKTDIGYNIRIYRYREIRYRVKPDIGIPDIGISDIGYTPISA